MLLAEVNVMPIPSETSTPFGIPFARVNYGFKWARVLGLLYLLLISVSMTTSAVRQPYSLCFFFMVAFIDASPQDSRGSPHREVN